MKHENIHGQNSTSPAAADSQKVHVNAAEFFATYIFTYDVSANQTPDLNHHLLTCIYDDRDKNPDGIERSNHRALGGWHSQNNLHQDRRFSAIVDIVDQSSQTVATKLGYDPEYPLRIGTMWSIINGPGSFNKAHIHPSSLWSGVYYVQAPENSGNIQFTDPRTANVMLTPRFGATRLRSTWTKVNYSPTAGRMLLFPSWLYHAVGPNLSEQKGAAADRVVISFNLHQSKR